MEIMPLKSERCAPVSVLKSSGFRRIFFHFPPPSIRASAVYPTVSALSEKNVTLSVASSAQYASNSSDAPSGGS